MFFDRHYMKRKRHYTMRKRRFSLLKRVYCWVRYRVFSRGCNRRIKKPREVEWYLRHWWRRGIWQVKGTTRGLITLSDYIACKISGRKFDLKGWNEIWNHEDDYYQVDKETGNVELLSGYKSYPDDDADHYVSVLDMPTKQKKPNAVLDQYYAEQLQRTEEYLKLEDPVVLAGEAKLDGGGQLASVFEPMAFTDWGSFAADCIVWAFAFAGILTLVRFVYCGLYRGRN